MNQINLEEFLEKKKTEKSSSTLIGHHFVESYNENKYKFFIRYILGIIPKTKKTYFSRGILIHDALEAFYLSGSNEFTWEVFNTVIKREWDNLGSTEDVRGKNAKCYSTMLDTWLAKYGTSGLESDFANYDVLEVEQEHKLILSDPLFPDITWPITGRLDVVLQKKDTKLVYILDHKVTQYSINATYKGLDLGDQSTLYLNFLENDPKYKDLSIAGLIPNIIYNKQSVYDAQRPGTIVRSQNRIRERTLEILGLLCEIAEKTQALAVLPVNALFPRNGSAESIGFTEEYPVLYQLPTGELFRLISDQGVKELDLMGYTLDNSPERAGLLESLSQIMKVQNETIRSQVIRETSEKET